MLVTIAGEALDFVLYCIADWLLFDSWSGVREEVTPNKERVGLARTTVDRGLTTDN